MLTLATTLVILYKITHPAPSEPTICHHCALYCTTQHQFHPETHQVAGEVDFYNRTSADSLLLSEQELQTKTWTLFN